MHLRARLERKIRQQIRRRVPALAERVRHTRASVPGLNMRVHADDTVVGYDLVKWGWWQPAERDVILSLLRPGMTFVDVGANVGYFTLLAAQRVGPTGRVLAIEPDPENYELLTRNVAANDLSHVQCVQAAAGAEPGRLALTRDVTNLGNHSLSSSNVPDPGDQVAVDVVTLDSLIDRADVIKVDVQGAEGAVLAGAVEVRSHGGTWVIEFWPDGLRRLDADPDHVLGELLALGNARFLDGRSVSAEEVWQACQENPWGQVDLIVGSR